MRFPQSFVLLVASAGLLDGVAAQAGGKGGQGQGGQAAAAAAAQKGQGGQAQNAGGDGTALNPAVIQTASASVGNVNATAGEAESLTSNNNFVNFCQGKTLTNGLQTKTGSCNGIGK